MFTFTGNAEVGQLAEETDANGAGYYSYVLLFRDVIYNGGGKKRCKITNLSHLNSTVKRCSSSAPPALVCGRNILTPLN